MPSRWDDPKFADHKFGQPRFTSRFGNASSGFGGGDGGVVPADALRDRDGNPILDRFGEYILTRGTQPS